MTKKAFRALRGGTVVDVLTRDLERTYLMTTVLRGYSGTGIWVEWPEVKRGRVFISNERRVELWKAPEESGAR